MHTRNTKLDIMGITQWQLKLPQVLRGDVVISLDQNIKLILVATDEQQPHQQFLQDILRSLNLSNQEYCWLHPKQALHLAIQQPVICCLFGMDSQIEFTINQELISVITSETFTDLKNSPASKRDFWYQLQKLQAHN